MLFLNRLESMIKKYKYTGKRIYKGLRSFLQLTNDLPKHLHCKIRYKFHCAVCKSTYFGKTKRYVKVCKA